MGSTLGPALLRGQRMAMFVILVQKFIALKLIRPKKHSPAKCELATYHMPIVGRTSGPSCLCGTDDKGHASISLPQMDLAREVGQGCELVLCGNITG